MPRALRFLNFPRVSCRRLGVVQIQAMVGLTRIARKPGFLEPGTLNIYYYRGVLGKNREMSVFEAI